MSRQQKAGRPHLVAATCAPCRPGDKTSCPDPDILAKLPSPSLDSAASSVKQTRTRGLPPPGALARASSAEITRDGCRGGGPASHARDNPPNPANAHGGRGLWGQKRHSWEPTRSPGCWQVSRYPSHHTRIGGRA